MKITEHAAEEKSSSKRSKMTLIWKQNAFHDQKEV